MKHVARFVLVGLIALHILPLAGCVRPILGEDGLGVVVEPVASLPRVQAGEASMRAYADELAGAVTSVAAKVGDTEAALRAEAAKARAEGEAALRAMEDEAQIDWTTIILAAFGVTGAGYTAKQVASRPKAAKPAA